MVMSVNVHQILEKLEKGDINSEEALHEINVDRQQDEVYNNHFLRVKVTGIDDNRPRVQVRIPLRILKTGFAIGAIYAPELKDLDLQQVVRDLHSLGDGAFIEVEDFEGDEKVVISIDQMKD
jgi:hypothetical protein